MNEKDIAQMIKECMDKHMAGYHTPKKETTDSKIDKAETISELDKAVKDDE